MKNYYRLSHLNKSQISEGVLCSVEGGFVKLGVDKNLLDCVYGAKINKKTTAWSSFKYPHLCVLTCLVRVKHVLL